MKKLLENRWLGWLVAGVLACAVIFLLATGDGEESKTQLKALEVGTFEYSPELAIWWEDAT